MLNLLRRRKRTFSVLDLPFTSYDPATSLPRGILIGETPVSPFVSIQELKDHLTLLATFHALQANTPNFPRFCERAAWEYQRWAQIVLPRARSRKNSPPSTPISTSSPIPISPPITPSTPGSKILDSDEEKTLNTPHDETRDHLAPDEMPSLGVLMCWHTMMLNPKLYALECAGPYQSLQGRRFPLRQVVEAIKEGTLPNEIDFEGTDFAASFAPTKWDPLDIAAAVMRQMKFIGNMEKIGWLNQGAWDQDVLPLARGNVRYHAWLDLMHSTSGKHFLVPTLDIDLSWHTHQLHGSDYLKDMQDVLGWGLGHDDTPSEGKLGDGLAITGKLWKRKFGYQYTY